MSPPANVQTQFSIDGKHARSDEGFQDPKTGLTNLKVRFISHTAWSVAQNAVCSFTALKVIFVVPTFSPQSRELEYMSTCRMH